MMQAGLLATLLLTALGGAHGAAPTCGDKDGLGGGAITNADCEAQNAGWSYNEANEDYECENYDGDPIDCDVVAFWGSLDIGKCCKSRYTCGDTAGDGTDVHVTNAQCDKDAWEWIFGETRNTYDVTAKDTDCGYEGCILPWAFDDDGFVDSTVCCTDNLSCEDPNTIYNESIVPISIFGAILAIVGIAISCAVGCCGQCKGKNVLIGWISILIGLVAMVVPLIAGSAMGGSAVDKFCEECTTAYCDDEFKERMEDKLNTLWGPIFGGLGFISMILGLISMIVGLVALCPCGNTNTNSAGAAAAGVVVVSTPAAPSVVMATAVVAPPPAGGFCTSCGKPKGAGAFCASCGTKA